MPLYPMELKIMLGKQIKKLFPKVDILRLFGFSTHPVPRLPTINPTLFYSVYYILAVAVYVYVTGLFELGKPRNNRHKLHTVIGGQAISAGKNKFFFLIF